MANAHAAILLDHMKNIAILEVSNEQLLPYFARRIRQFERHGQAIEQAHALNFRYARFCFQLQTARATSDPRAAAATLKREVRPPAVHLFRSAPRLSAALRAIGDALAARSSADVSLAASRSAYALLYVAKLSYTSALARRETRGLNRRDDFPLRTGDASRLLIGGVKAAAISWKPIA